MKTSQSKNTTAKFTRPVRPGTANEKNYGSRERIFSVELVSTCYIFHPNQWNNRNITQNGEERKTPEILLKSIVWGENCWSI